MFNAFNTIHYKIIINTCKASKLVNKLPNNYPNNKNYYIGQNGENQNRFSRE